MARAGGGINVNANRLAEDVFAEVAANIAVQIASGKWPVLAGGDYVIGASLMAERGAGSDDEARGVHRVFIRWAEWWGAVRDEAERRKGMKLRGGERINILGPNPRAN